MKSRAINWPPGKRRVAFLCMGVLLSLVGVCVFFRISHTRDLTAMLEMNRECHPIWRQFAIRRFGHGSSASRMLQLNPATRTEQFGRYCVYHYHRGSSNDIGFTSLAVVAKDGRLVSAAAGSCTWTFVFFQTQDADLAREHAAYFEQKLETNYRKWLDKLEIALVEFSSRHNRWPTNTDEFSVFVTHSPSSTTNDLGVILDLRNDGAMEISFLRMPNDKRSVRRPTAKPN